MPSTSSPQDSSTHTSGDGQRPPGTDSLIGRSIDSLPFTMANPLSRSERARAEGDYKEALINLLDFFEMTVQWLNCYLISRLSEMMPQADGAARKALQRTVGTIDAKRPLSFGDHVNELLHQLMAAAVRMTPGDPLVKALSAHVVSSRFNILAGSARQRGVVKVRNDFKGHSTSLAQTFYRQALESLSPHLEAMLLGLEPLHRYSFYAADHAGRLLDARCCGDTLAPAGIDAPRQPGHYYVEADDGRLCDLWPLAIVSDDGYIFLFQTLKDDSVCYESSSQMVHRFETEEFNAPMDAALGRILPSFDVAREANWQEITAASAEHSRAYLLQVQKEKKFSSELFVDRRELSATFRQFVSDPSRTLLALPGEAGQGKTNQLCHWTSELLRDGKAVMIFNCSELGARGLPAMMRDILHTSRRRSIEKVLESLHSKADEAGENICFLFDALNECLSYTLDDGSADSDGPTALFRDIVTLLVRTDRPRFKVVATCRSFTWENRIVPAVRADPLLNYKPEGSDGYSVGGFSAEETEEAYRIYGKLYQMGSEFDTIDPRILLRLRDPLTLKYACGNNVGKPFKDDPGEFTSMRLFATMTDDICHRSFAGHLQCMLLDELADRLLQSYLSGEPSSHIPAPALRQALTDDASPLHRLATMIYSPSGGVSVAYAELLRNPERPILKESVRTLAGGERSTVVEFIYERFLEYTLCLAFRRKFAPQCPMAADYLAVLDSVDANVVLLGALRNSMLMDIAEDRYATLLELIGRHSTRTDVMQLTNDVIDVLIRENYEPQLFKLQQRMLDAMPDDVTLIGNYNDTQRRIAAAEATPELIAAHRNLSARLAPVKRLRSAASVSLANMLLSDYFNEDLYAVSPLQLMWRLMEDSITDVSDEACKQAYYLSRRRFTRGGAPLRENLTARIVREMFDDIQSRSIPANLAGRRRRRRMIRFIETGVRLAVLLIIDACMAPQPDDALASDMLARIRGIASYATMRFAVVRLAMPFLQTVMRRQITFQSEYVNNAIEYMSYWDDSVVPPESGNEGTWSRPLLGEAMRFVGHYGRVSRGLTDGADEAAEFAACAPAVIDAYRRGCSFSYFVLERILVVMGTASWANIRPLITSLLDPSHRRGPWSDYSQMSILYVLYQVQKHSAADNQEILDIYTREAADWTRRCRGRFKGRNSEKANSTGLYKRNVMNWYGAVYCCHTGDGIARGGDSRCAPLFYELIDQAIASDDREMLLHLLDSISEMIGDCGLIELPLQLMRHILGSYGRAEDVRRIDAAPSANPAHDGKTLVKQAGLVLSMAHRYFPARTRRFLQSELAGLSFPGVATYREEILGNIGDTEKLSDLFTYRFGNFLMWSLLNSEAVDRFATEAICAAPGSRDCFQWYDNVVRILCRHLFNIKI